MSAGMTGLHLCAIRGYVGMAELLLTNGIGINLTDDAGWTALHTSAAYSQEGLWALIKKIPNSHR